MASNKLTGMAREVAEKYRETLVTLTFNNKIVINTLTEIAKEDTKYANVIVDCIEARLRKVRFTLISSVFAQIIFMFFFPHFNFLLPAFLEMFSSLCLYHPNFSEFIG